MLQNVVGCIKTKWSEKLYKRFGLYVIKHIYSATIEWFKKIEDKYK